MRGKIMFWDNYKSFCDRISKSPNAVASELGYSSGSVTAWKNGRVPKWESLKKIADYFNVSVETLIKDDNKKELPESEKLENCVVFHRDGKTSVKALTAAQVKAIEKLIDSMDGDTPEYL